LLTQARIYSVPQVVVAYIYNSHTLKNESFCVLYAHSQFLCSLSCVKMPTLGVRQGCGAGLGVGIPRSRGFWVESDS